MTKKDYIKFAEVLNHSRPCKDACEGPQHYKTKLQQWIMDVYSICEVLAEDNNRFNYSKFYEACGLNEV